MTKNVIVITGLILRGAQDWDTSKPNGPPRRKLDTSRAKRLFGFEARTPFEVGLRRTIEWYQRERSNDFSRSVLA